MSGTGEKTADITIFDEQVSRKPDRYPWTQKFIEAAHNGFWTDKEFNFNSDKQDFNTQFSQQEKDIIVRALATIGQLEISVKKFWAKLGENLPHPSLFDLGYVLANQEVIHGSSYERLLEVLGIDDAFDNILELDFIKGRVNYLRKHLHKFHEDNKKQFVYSLILFTLFIENIALFSQFYTIMWFGREKNLLKDTNKQVEYTSREECYIEGTEVLTPIGWVNLSNIKVGDSVFQFTELGEIEHTKVLNTISKDFSGNLISFSKKNSLCIVTPGHEMIYKHRFTNKLTKVSAENLKLHTSVKIPIGGVLNSLSSNTLSFEERLQVAIQADGSTLYWINKDGDKLLRGKSGGSTHSISLTRPRKIKRLRWILSNLSLEFSESNPDKDGKIVFLIKYNQNFDYKNLNSWINLKEVSLEWCQSFVEEVVEWDGYKEGKHTGYSSIRKDNIDIVQVIAILAGYTTSIMRGTEVEQGKSEHPCYKLNFKKENHWPMSHAVKKKNVPYIGKVNCISVESGVIITRYKDKTFIAGNCLHSEVGIKLINVIREERPDLFDDKLEEKIRYEAEQAINYEFEIVEWIINGYDHDTLNSTLVREFIKDRMNKSLIQIGYKNLFKVDSELVKKTKWFDELILGNNMSDFFASKPVEYNKKGKCFSEDELF